MVSAPRTLKKGVCDKILQQGKSLLEGTALIGCGELAAPCAQPRGIAVTNSTTTLVPS
jgi:hypothetical protein